MANRCLTGRPSHFRCPPILISRVRRSGRFCDTCSRRSVQRHRDGDFPARRAPYVLRRTLHFAAHALQARRDAAAITRGVTPTASVAAELLHFFGEIEVIFGLWAVPLAIAIWMSRGWNTLTDYLDGTVNYTEAVFVVVIMALASTRPVIELAESALRKVATLGGGTPAAWWLTILTIGPLLGSLVTEPAAMTIAALLLRRQFYDLEPFSEAEVRDARPALREHLDRRNAHALRRAADADGGPALGLEHAVRARPLRLARDACRRACRRSSTTSGFDASFNRWRRDGASTATAIPSPRRVDYPSRGGSRPIYVAFLVWTVVNAHHPVLFVGGFLFFLGFDRATAVYSTLDDFKTPLLVGFFLAALVIHGGLQGWWIAPVLSRLAQGTAVCRIVYPHGVQR